MKAIGIRELKEQTSEILRRVREEGDSFEVTYHGRVVARLIPVAQPELTTSPATFWAEWDRLSEAISARWPAGISSVDAIREQRREL